MTSQVDRHARHPAAAAEAARAAGGAQHVHPTTPVHVEYSLVPVFDVIAEPLAGRLELFGELDLGGGQRFRDASAAILAGGAAEVVIDLTRLRFIDASGIGILVELRNELAAHGATLRVVNPDARIGRVFSCVG